MLSISGRHSRSSQKWWVFKGDEGRGGRERERGEWILTFLFFSFYLVLQQPTTFPLYTASFSAQFFVLFRGQCKIKIRTHRDGEWNALLGQGDSHSSRLRLSNYHVRVVSISNATNWKFSAGQSLRIQDYQIATKSFFYYLFFHCIIVLLTILLFYYNIGTIDTNIISSN